MPSGRVVAYRASTSQVRVLFQDWFLSWVIIKNTKIKQQEKAGGNFDRQKARRGVMDALSTYQQLLTERKRKTQFTLDDFLTQRQKIGNTEDTV
ncbi:hypothetical protein TNCV_4153931 [Trichonephila clavipes]|nr:hypothetical protein TNCV_4153931 [Trichonephila clavipes]